MFRVSDIQRHWLEGLRCVRLSSEVAHLREVDGFYNRRNDTLAEALKGSAFEEDESGDMAYYVVKDGDGRMLFFFSLKCGMLYDEHLDDRRLKQIRELFGLLDAMSQDEGLSGDERQSVEFVREKLRSRKGVTKADLERLPKKGIKLIDDLELEFNENITHVGVTYPSIELVHFCKNDEHEQVVESLDLEFSLGMYVFWRFVVPVLLDVRSLVGCKYLFLFAADSSDDKQLVFYYRERLNFSDQNDKATAKPLYDLGCKFMYQEIEGLKEMREGFLKECWL